MPRLVTAVAQLRILYAPTVLYCSIHSEFRTMSIRQYKGRRAEAAGNSTRGTRRGFLSTSDASAVPVRVLQLLSLVQADH